MPELFKGWMGAVLLAITAVSFCHVCTPPDGCPPETSLPTPEAIAPISTELRVEPRATGPDGHLIGNSKLEARVDQRDNRCEILMTPTDLNLNGDEDVTPQPTNENAAKLATGGTMTIGRKTVSLPNVTAYESQQINHVVTVVMFTERPIDPAKLKESLVNWKNDHDLIKIHPHLRLEFNADNKLESIGFNGGMYCGARSTKATFVIDGGQARGTAKTSQIIIEGIKYDFDVTFDATVAALPVGEN